ncbi:acyl-CoA dehydrogenase family protein [Gordonia polyisoprenivorans]|uniref:acyl-CoA dehydrogenase family protein n=1 Tax=Gordonia polyisoprenivorans TaxID=84595 RepID=UPI001FCBC70B|nr:acyl-CoA dehydrogenase family protein [Gordonia polyisoprenivorans]
MAHDAQTGSGGAPDLAAFADEARAFLDAHARRRDGANQFEWGKGSDYVGYFGDPEADEQADVAAARAWQRVRYENGFGWITGPKAYGGRELSSLHDFIYDLVETEYDVADTGTLSVIGLGMVGPTILAHGSEYLRETYLPAMYRGDSIACQLFSEPAAGSDLAGVTTRAVRDADEWVVNGQKVWTSVAHHSQFGELLCRTDPDAPKHRGITAFVMDLSLPGVTVRPLRQMTGGAEFNEVFLDNVRIPDSHRLGEVNAGWKVAMTTLMNERGTVAADSGGAAAEAIRPERLYALMQHLEVAGDPVARQDLASVATDVLAARALTARATRRLKAGMAPGPEGSIAKLSFAANLSRGAHFATDLLGDLATADHGEWGTFNWNQLLLGAPALRILGGTEEIMKNIIAERVLGLPKEATK